MTGIVANPDVGARTVSPSVALSEGTVGAYVTLAAFAGEGAVIGAGDGSLWRATVGPDGLSLVRLAGIGETPLLAAADPAGGSVLIGTDGGRVVAVGADGGVATVAALGPAWIGAIAVHRAGGRRAFAAGKAIALYDAAGAALARLDDHPSTVTGLAFAPDGAWLAASHYDGVSLWRLDGHAHPPVRMSWHGSHTALSWSPDGRYIVTAMQDRELHGWRMPARTSVRMNGYPSKIRALSWTADSAYLAASGADTVTSWSFAGHGPSGRPPLEFGYVFNGIVTQVAAHPRARTVAGGYNDGTVLIGTIETGNAAIACPGEGSPVSALAWARDGRTLIAGMESGRVAAMRLVQPIA